MKRPILIGEAAIPNSTGVMRLYQGKDDYTISLANGGGELMSTRKHGSEDALGALACAEISNTNDATVLIGGLGMGFTLAAILSAVGEGASVTVAELIPEVIEWNMGPLGERAGRPLEDSRTRVVLADVAQLLKQHHKTFDVIALDVDNGPEGLTTRSNNWLYSTEGLLATMKALNPGGVVAYWSASADKPFKVRLCKCGFQVKEMQVRAHGTKGAMHVIYLACV